MPERRPAQSGRGGADSPEPDRRAVAHVRSGVGELWDLARDNGSTVRAIQRANELEELCLSRERLLLIPTGRGVMQEEEDAE